MTRVKSYSPFFTSGRYIDHYAIRPQSILCAGRLRAWSSKLKPFTSSEGHWNSRLTLFSAVLSFDSLTDNLSSRSSSFDHSLKANQLGPDLVKVYLLLDYYIWNIFDFCKVIQKVLPKMYSIDFFDFRSQNGMTPP